MTSPFVFDVAELLRGPGLPVQESNTGQSPVRVGVPMIAVDEGAEVTVDATLTPLGEGVMVDATVTAPLTGQCSRCLRDLSAERSFTFNEVFSASESFIQGDAVDPEDDEVPAIVNDRLDTLQTFIDAAVLELPFNPTCEDILGEECEDNDVPLPDGISGEEDQDRVDPRWAGLEKFL